MSSNQLDIFRNNFWGNPFRELNQIQSAMEKLFNYKNPVVTADEKKLMDFSPNCEVSEDKNQYMFKFDLPGVGKDQVRVELNDNILTVTAERKEEKKTDDKKHFSEVYYGSYTRSFALPTSVRSSTTKASFENGVLMVAISKVEPTQTKKIEIQ